MGSSGHNRRAMGFWPFGREPADIEMVSRVVSAVVQSGHRVRGKLTIHFSEPQRQGDADHAGDRAASLAIALLKEQPDHGKVIGAEVALSAELGQRYPGDLARARAVELAALHVVGDPALSDELRRASSQSGSMPAVVPPASGRPPPQEQSSAGGGKPLSQIPRSAPPPSNTPPAPPVAPSQLPPRRRGSSQIRSIQSLLMPPGTTPLAMGQFVAPLVKDSAARLLIGFLRAHDLIGVRGVTIDDGSAETLATLVPASDAALGGYEASRAGEITRWQATLGQGPMFALHHEVRVAAAHLAREALAQAEVMPQLADAVVEAICQHAFADEAGVLTELGRFPTALTPAFVSTLAQNLTRIAGTSEDPGSIAAALTPLVGTVRDDLAVAASIIKQSS